MIFITGGASQGKRNFASDRLGAAVFADGRDLLLTEPVTADCFTDYQELIRRIMDMGGDPIEFTERLCRERPDIIVIMNETGCGIVPLDKTDRLWRENTGRCGCILAGAAELAVRMICGIPTVLKGELP